MLEAEIAEIFAKVGKIDAAQLTSATDLSELGLDSILMVEVMFAVEEQFDVSIPFAADVGPLTFGGFVNQIADLVQARG